SFSLFHGWMESLFCRWRWGRGKGSLYKLGGKVLLCCWIGLITKVFSWRDGNRKNEGPCWVAASSWLTLAFAVGHLSCSCGGWDLDCYLSLTRESKCARCAILRLRLTDS